MSRKVMAVSALAALLLAGCGHRQRAAEPPRVTPPTSTTVPATPTPAPPTTPAPAPPTKGHPAHVLADGRYPAYLTAIDVPGRTLTFDVIQWLTGKAAEEAFHEDYPGMEGAPPNGYYIRNVSQKLRALPVRQNVPVEVVWLGEGSETEHTTFEALPDYFAGDLNPDDKYLWYDPFWLTVHDDRIESIVEQYTP